MKRHIGHMIMVSLKYFFDIDHNVCSQTFLTVLAVAGIVKLLFGNAIGMLHNGLLIAKQDMLTVREQLVSYKEKWNIVK